MPEQYPGSKRPVFGRQQATILFGVFVCVMLGIFILRSAMPRDTVQADHADANNAQLVARGQQLYAIHCISCHGAAMQGQVGWEQRPIDASSPAPPLNASGPAPQRSDQQLFTTIRQGSLESTAMPAFPSLSSSDIWALVSAMKTTWTP